MAIQVSGTSVINNSRQLQNIASVDSTTAASITAAGVGGGTIGFSSATTYNSSTFTKPNNGTNIFMTYYNSTTMKEVSGTVPSTYEIVQTPAFSSSAVVEVVFKLPTPNTFSQRQGYWGDVIIFGVKNTTTNKSTALFLTSAPWNTQTGFPAEAKTFLTSADANDRFFIAASDVYNNSAGTGFANSNLVFNANTANIIVKTLTIT